MITKKHYDVILTELIKNNRVKVCVIDDIVWFVPQAGVYAIAIPKRVQFFDISKIRAYENTDTFNPKDTTALIPTGAMIKEGAVILHELKAEPFTSWVNGEHLKLFPLDKYTYYAKGKLSAVFCKSRVSDEIEGFVMPVRRKE